MAKKEICSGISLPIGVAPESMWPRSVCTRESLIGSSHPPHAEKLDVFRRMELTEDNVEIVDDVEGADTVEEVVESAQPLLVVTSVVP